MLVSMRKSIKSPTLVVRWDALAQGNANVARLDQKKLTSCMQMLHRNESSMLAVSDNVFVSLKNVGDNEFVLTFGQTLGSAQYTDCEARVSVRGALWRSYTSSGTLDHSMEDLLRYARFQLLPRYSQAAAVAQNLQRVFGSVLTRSAEACDSRVDDCFMRNNSTVVSKLTDMLNGAHCGKKILPSAVARFAWLAAVFCSAAPPSKSFSMFHVTQMQVTDMSDYTVERLYEHAPEKQHLTVLMRGESADDRIRRFNVAVRMFAADSEFVKELLPKLIGLNAAVYSPVMVVAGVRNNQAAAVFLSSESLTTAAHSSAMHTFLCGLSPAP